MEIMKERAHLQFFIKDMFEKPVKGFHICAKLRTKNEN